VSSCDRPFTFSATRLPGRFVFLCGKDALRNRTVRKTTVSTAENSAKSA
jgi:hypothetical protein